MQYCIKHKILNFNTRMYKMNTEKYMEYCFDNYNDQQSDYEYEDIDINGSINKKPDIKSAEEQRKIKKSIEDIIEQRRLKEETDFL